MYTSLCCQVWRWWAGQVATTTTECFSSLCWLQVVFAKLTRKLPTQTDTKCNIGLQSDPMSHHEAVICHADHLT